MPIVSVIFGALLIGLGIWGGWDKLTTGLGSNTAFIPAFFGIPLVILGLLALKESLLKHTMHAAAMVGLLGLIGGIANLIRIKGNLSGRPGQSTAALTGLCAVFVLLCANSFIQARRRRRAREAAAANQPLPTP